MTQNSKLKKVIRARMAETGEKYMQARRVILAERAKEEAREVVADLERRSEKGRAA